MSEQELPSRTPPEAPKWENYRQATAGERAMARGFISLWDSIDVQDADDWLYTLRNRAELLVSLDEDDDCREAQDNTASLGPFTPINADDAASTSPADLQAELDRQKRDGVGVFNPRLMAEDAKTALSASPEADQRPPKEPSGAIKAFAELCITLCAVFGEVKSWPKEVHDASEKVGVAISAAEGKKR